jgi:hypothetical protein
MSGGRNNRRSRKYKIVNGSAGMGSQESDFNLAGMQECSVHFFYLIY